MKKNYKYFIGYLYNDHKVKPLHIMLLKTSAYVKIYDGKFMMEKFKPVYNKIFLKTKIKSHGNEVTDFYDKTISKVDSNHTYLAVIRKMKIIIYKCF